MLLFAVDARAASWAIIGGDGEDSSDNTIVIEETTVSTVYGGRDINQINESLVRNNVVSLNVANARGSVFGGYTSSVEAASAVNNTVRVFHSSVTDDVIGSKSRTQTGIISEASNSFVLISDSSIVSGQVIGGLALMQTPVETPMYAFANDNMVYITRKSNVYNDVIGGSVDRNERPDITDDSFGFSMATNNAVIIEDSTLWKEGTQIVGGLAYGNNGQGFANLNKVYLRSVTFPVDTEVYGGIYGKEYTSGVVDNGDVFWNNLLTFGSEEFPWNDPVVFKRIANFEKFDFWIPSDIEKDSVVVNTKNLVVGDGHGNGSYVNSIQFVGTTVPGLKENDILTLIQSENPIVDPNGKLAINEGRRAFKSSELIAQWGSLFVQTLYTSATNNSIIAKTDPAPTPITRLEDATRVIQTVAGTPTSSFIPTTELSVFPETALSVVPAFDVDLKNYEQKVKYNTNGETYVRHGKGHHRHGMTQEKREERRAAWNALSTEEKEARRQLHIDRRNARTEGSLFERTGRHHRRGTASE
jgi:hypothetical protein